MPRPQAPAEGWINVPPALWRALQDHTLVMSAAVGTRRAATIVLGAHQCGVSPPLISVAIRGGQLVDPIIRDGRTFALCTLDATERVFAKRMHDGTGRGLDCFDGVRIDRLRSLCPILSSSVLALDCEVVRHLDLESDHQLYIGRILALRTHNLTPTLAMASG